MRAADYVAQLLVQKGITHAFMVTGGGAMHLNDAFGRAKGLSYVCCHHEQACAIAAESYGRISGRPALLSVTTGPGGINALNGVFGAYVDSIPMVVVSGQVKRETIAANFPIGLRQLGDQEVDIAGMVRGISKYAVVVQDASRIRYEVEKAFHLATTGRPGPVWLDIPIDIQAAPIDVATLKGFDPAEEVDDPTVPTEAGLLTGPALRAAAQSVLERLKGATRPCILAGAGVRLSGAHEAFLSLIDTLSIPVTTGWNAHDVLWNDHPCYVGRPGSVGDRAGNFAVQNSDFLLVLGSRLNVRQISYNWQSFARSAFKVMVDVDAAELQKPTLSIDLPLHADLKEFLFALNEAAQTYAPPAEHSVYLKWCRQRTQRYPVVLPEYWHSKKGVNPYCFVDALFDQLEEGDVVVSGDGTACVVTFQAAKLKPGQRLYTNSGCASMGYDVPAAIGAWYGQPGLRRVICLAGDGSLMMNLQELQTIVGQKLPVKLFILNNNGYHSIRQTQQNYFPDNVVGCGPESGLTFPDFQKVGTAFGFVTRVMRSHADMKGAIGETLRDEGAQLCEVMLDPDQAFAPKISSRRLEDGRMVSAPLEDMAPFLSREELLENMLIPVETF